MKRLFLAALLAAGLGAGPVQADGHFALGLGLGLTLPLLYGWPYYYYPPYYPYYYYPPPPAYVPPPSFVVQAPVAEQPFSWYYCRQANGYYPYVKECPAGWERVSPVPPR